MAGMENLSEILGDMLTTKEVADRLGVSVAKVHRMVAAKVLQPQFKVDGQTGSFYFKAADVDELKAAS